MTVSSPQLGVAVRAAEARTVVHVLVGHQPLQRINRLLTRHAGLPHRQEEALHTLNVESFIHPFIWNRMDLCSRRAWCSPSGLTLGVFEGGESFWLEDGVPGPEPEGTVYNKIRKWQWTLEGVISQSKSCALRECSGLRFCHSFNINLKPKGRFTVAFWGKDSPVWFKLWTLKIKSETSSLHQNGPVQTGFSHA